MKESPLFWPAEFRGEVLHVLDETLIPRKLQTIKVRNVAQSVKVIRDMKTRAFGQFLVVLNTFLLLLKTSESIQDEDLVREIQETADALNNSRPTFPFAEVTGFVVHWAQAALKEGQDIRQVVTKNCQGYLQGIRYRRLERVQKVAALLVDGDRVLTHCNVSGELAMAAAIARENKKQVSFFATETRPYFQGAKLTCWELQQAGIPVTLVADNAIGTLMADGLITKVIVGSDRSCANGDFANKIGTYQIAVLAKEFNVPMFALTQPSNKVAQGQDIPIEIREEKELLYFEGKKMVAGKMKAFYPGFDVTPRELIQDTVAIDAKA